MIKKNYEIDEDVWVHGITRDNKLTKGTVIKKFTLDHPDYHNDQLYVVSIPTHIEPLLEIRSWETMSQDARGPIGMYRDLQRHKLVIDKFMSRTGYIVGDTDDTEPTEEEIVAALEKSQKVAEHEPLVLKPAGPKRRRFPRKKKQ